MPLPVEIVALNRTDFTIAWEDGHSSTWKARDLRCRCRCALCIEEMTGARLLDPAAVPDDLVARGIEVIGNYAMNVTWSDGHAHGIYNFVDLRADCPCAECTAARAKT